MAEDTLIFLARRLGAVERRQAALSWCWDVLEALPPTDSRTADLGQILVTAHLAHEDVDQLRWCWVRVQALRTPQEAPLWFWARGAWRNAMTPQTPLDPLAVAQAAEAVRQVVARLAGDAAVAPVADEQRLLLHNLRVRALLRVAA